MSLVTLVGCTDRALPLDDGGSDSGSEGSDTSTSTGTGIADTSTTRAITTLDPSPGSTETFGDDTGFDDGFFPDFGSPSCFDDFDCDGIPDAVDPFLDDASLPDRIEREMVLANSADSVLEFDTRSFSFTAAFPLVLEGMNRQLPLVDLAIDTFGVLYALTPTDLLVCSVETITCTVLGPVAGFNAAGFVDGELWLASAEGEIAVVRDHAHDPIVELLGFMPPQYRSRGDLAGANGVVLLSSPSPGGESDTVIVLDEGTLSLLFDFRDNADLPRFTGIGGIALWQQNVVLFSETGEVHVLDGEGNATSATMIDVALIGGASFPPHGEF